MAMRGWDVVEQSRISACYAVGAGKRGAQCKNFPSKMFFLVSKLKLYVSFQIEAPAAEGV